MRLQLTSTLPSTIFSVLFGSFIAKSIPCAHATALTTYLAANERSCFYADVDSEFMPSESSLTRLLITCFQVSGKKSVSTFPCNQADLSTSTIWCKTRTRESFWRDKGKDRATTSLLPIP